MSVINCSCNDVADTEEFENIWQSLYKLFLKTFNGLITQMDGWMD